MRGLQGLRQQLRRLVQSEAELLALSERLASGGLASTSAPSAAAISALVGNGAALQRLAPRLLATLAGGGGRAVPRGLGGRALRQEMRQVRPGLVFAGGARNHCLSQAWAVGVFTQHVCVCRCATAA